MILPDVKKKINQSKDPSLKMQFNFKYAWTKNRQTGSNQILKICIKSSVHKYHYSAQKRLPILPKR